MVLIADSGSTKTKWVLLTENGTENGNCITSGINPFFQQSSEIVETLKSEFQIRDARPSSIYFYGAGVANEEKEEVLRTALSSYFDAHNIFAESDLMAAARSLCGKNPGIAAIMGTGSNSCYYDGTDIVQNVSPLGYILGDEGSGAVLGKMLVGDILKNMFPRHLITLFFEKYNLTPGEIIENVYRRSFPNRYLAGFTPFLSENIKEEAVYDLVLSGFMAFFKRNISKYSAAGEMPVHFTGSVAWHFRDVLKEAASKNGFEVGKILADPMPGLLDYHRSI